MHQLVHRDVMDRPRQGPGYMDDFAGPSSNQAVVSDDCGYPRDHCNHRKSDGRSSHFHDSFHAIFRARDRERHTGIELARNADRLTFGGDTAPSPMSTPSTQPPKNYVTPEG